MKKLFLVLFVTTNALSGCASFIQTKHAELESINTGISYYLPKRVHRLIVTAENLHAEKEEKKLKEAEANFDTINKQAKQLEIEMKKLKSTAANTPGEKAKRKATEAAQTAEGIYLATKEIADKAKNDMEMAKSRYDQVKNESDPKKCNYFIAMSIIPQALEPDTKYPFLLKLNHSPLRDDELKIKTTQSGLLTSADVASTDRTGDIVVEIAKAVAMFGIPLPISVRGYTNLSTEIPQKGQQKKPPTCYPSIMKHDQIVDFGLSTDIPITIVFRDSSGFEVKKDDYVLPPALTVAIDFPKNTKKISSKETEPETNSENATGLKEESKDTKPIKSALETIYDADEGLKEFSYPLKGHYGILYRRDTTYLVDLKAEVDAKETIVASQQISMPNLSPVALVPFEYFSLVTTKNNAVFENGMLVSYDTNQPSSALAFANLPARIAEGYINVLTNFLQLKFDYSSKAIDAVSKEKELADLLKIIQNR